MKNRATDLNKSLHDQLERLNNENLSPEELDREIRRSHAITTVTKCMIENGSVVLEAEKLRRSSGTLPGRGTPLPDLLSDGTTRLHNHLVCQIERLDDVPDRPTASENAETPPADPLDIEIRRTNAISNVAHHAIDNANLVLRAERLKRSTRAIHAKLPPMLNAD